VFARAHSHRVRPTWPALVVLALSTLFSPKARSENWSGFRGQENQAASATPCPTSWSDDHNIRWNTPIPGRGHSSPVIWNDHIYVTTVYPADDWQTLTHRLCFVEIILAALIFAASLFSIRSTSARITGLLPFLSLTLAALVTIAIPSIILLGDNAMDFHRSRIRAWIGSSLLAFACLVISAWRLPSWSSLRRPLALLSLIVSAAFLLFIPEKFRAYRFGLSGLNTYVLLSLAAIPFFIAISLLTRRDQDPPPPSAKRSRWNLALAAPATLVALLFLAAILLYAKRHSPYFAYHLANIQIQPASGRGGGLLFAAASGAFLLLLICLGPRRCPTSARFAPLMLAALYTFHSNFLEPRQEDLRALLCLDRATGQILWTVQAFAGPVEPLHRDNSPATPTPVADDRAVYAYFGSPGLMAVSHSGHLLWTATDLPYHSQYGPASSPVLYDGRLVISNDQPGQPYLAALDAATGRRLWTTPLPNDSQYIGGSGRTPELFLHHGQPVILVWTFSTLCLFHLDSGQALQLFPLRSYGEIVPTPILTETRAYFTDRESIRCFALDDLFSPIPHPLWTTRITGPDTASPLLSNNRIFTISYGGIATCTDAQTGQRLWKHRIDGIYYASPIAAGNNVYFTSNQGIVTVIPAAPPFSILSPNDLSSLSHLFFATPAPVDGKLYFRSTHGLCCVGADE
jgi:outer membrane protein assembly factor BamB